jgi:hypothetical protein
MKMICAFFLLSLTYATAALPVPMEDKRAVDIDAGFLGNRYKQESRLLQPGSMYKVLSAYPEAKDLAASSKGWQYPALGFGAAGGALVGYTGVQPLFGREFNAPLFFSGVGAIAVGMVFGKVADTKLAGAVRAYNKALGGAALRWDIVPEGHAWRAAWRF